jgi:hypothetical protein
MARPTPCRKHGVKFTGTTVHGPCAQAPGCAMPQMSDLLLAACMFLGAALYTSVGHAGASAYIALMALFGVAPAVLRPTALALNLLVASFTSFRYVRAGMFRWRVLWPFLLGAMPLAFIGAQRGIRFGSSIFCISLNRSRGWPQEGVEPLSYDGVALTRCLFEAGSAENLNFSPTIVDKAGLLHRLRCKRHRFAIGTQHVRDILYCTYDPGHDCLSF